MTHHPASHADLPSLLELAEVVATCIPLLPPAGQKNIGRVVEQMALIAQAGHEWMPIDSAPRDGTVVILSGRNQNYPGQVMTTGKFNEYGTWECFGVWVSPISWHPLPPPPKESE